MTKAVVVEEFGDYTKLKEIQIADQKPNANQVLLKQEVLGINFHDILYRSGKRVMNSDPKILGFEAVGTIEEVGAAVEGLQVGMRVAYATAPVGAYRDYRCIHQKYVVALPDQLDSKMTAACFFKGLTAHYLLFRTYFVRERDTILVHSAASGVGSMMAKWASNLGVTVIGTVSSDAKKEIATNNGCKYVFNRNSEDWVQGVADITSGKGLNVVYDSVGVATIDGSIKVLSKLGILVLFGQSSGRVVNIQTRELTNKSLFLAMPSIFDYKAERAELVLSAQELFKAIELGFFQEQISQEFAFHEMQQAHLALESQSHINSIIVNI